MGWDQEVEGVLSEGRAWRASALKMLRESGEWSWEVGRRLSRSAVIAALAGRELRAGGRLEEAGRAFAEAAVDLRDARRRVEAGRLAGLAVECDGGLAGELIELVGVGVPDAFSRLEAEVEGNGRLRRPQVEACAAVWSHFAASDEPALVQLPVGCGKTGVMALLPFGLRAGRVLVVTPGVEIRRQVVGQLDGSSAGCFWRRTGVLGGEVPVCAELRGEANILDCDGADVVVANIQQLVSGDAERWLWQLAPGYFSVVLIDEGHHAAAASWQAVLERFEGAQVVTLTATPERADGGVVPGRLVYRFGLGEAVREGYVKELVSWRVDPGEMRFTYRGMEASCGLDEVLSYREEEWFSRGVAMAPECSRPVVDASIRGLRDQRSRSGRHHSILAAACSIDHARLLLSQYEERGCRAGLLHSHLPVWKQERVREGLRRGELDVVVQVQMLGEGADYPSLSVAAIFRPFRHFTTYLQFVGRILRVLEERRPGHVANRGLVVAHAGLHVERWWQRLLRFDEESGSRSARVASGVVEEEEGVREVRRRFVGDMEVLEERVVGVVEDRLSVGREGEVVALRAALEAQGWSLGELGLDGGELERRVQARGAGEQRRLFEPLAVSPQQAREAARRRLNGRVRSAGRRLLLELGLSVRGRELAEGFEEPPKGDNLALAIILLNREVKRFLGVASRQRRSLSLEELQSATAEMDALIDGLARRMAAASR